MREVRAAGREALELATGLLQRVRRADPEAGLWEAADVQWWWRTPRPSDEVDKLFWVDDEGPIAGVLLTSWTDDAWQCDPTTKVGLVEPVGVEDEFQRRGLARAMLSAGIERLVARGAQRVKVSYETDAASALYQGIGFRPTSTTTWYGAASASQRGRTI